MNETEMKELMVQDFMDKMSMEPYKKLNRYHTEENFNKLMRLSTSRISAPCELQDCMRGDLEQLRRLHFVLFGEAKGN